MPKVLIVYGPNLNLLGERDPHIYGKDTLEDISARLHAVGAAAGVEIEVFHSNAEGTIIDKLHAARTTAQAVVLNAGALSHYSYALREAISAIKIPVIEVHMTNVLARGEFRTSLILAPACKGLVFGFGVESFVLGLEAAIRLTKPRRQTKSRPKARR